MGLAEDVTSREGIRASMEDVALKQFLFLRNLTDPVIARFGKAGLRVLYDAFRYYGQWRGDNIRMSQASLVAGHDALSFLDNWDSCDFVLAGIAGEISIEGNAVGAAIRLPHLPGTAYFKSHQGKLPVLHEYWKGLLRGLPAGYDEKLSLTCTEASLDAPWSIRASFGGAPAGKTSVADVVAGIRNIFAEPARALALVRNTSRNAGALYMFIAREVIRAWDATGEQIVREGVRGIGRERGSVLREKHEREGKPLNLKTLMLDWDGPLISTWVFNGEGYLSEGTWHQDCRYCPYADVWGEFGKEGLALGLLYDIELHTTMYQTYHPGTIVRWDALKTRGDHLCKFRISIPELVSPNDPEYVRPAEG
ncbi:MAG TPA: L-2-amino-thiazoline-4-carboxylic acid hydrolase [Alphaproteobacteria bacterium]|nr:L-2-amino-thiazoline-4-carboxylic acid hydrolase [Alphaproteobacteria bacterium]